MITIIMKVPVLLSVTYIIPSYIRYATNMCTGAATESGVPRSAASCFVFSFAYHMLGSLHVVLNHCYYCCSCYCNAVDAILIHGDLYCNKKIKKLTYKKKSQNHNILHLSMYILFFSFFYGLFFLFSLSL